ncbi:MAG: GHMP kinase [Bacteroidetes bacterium]|nr:GHMP kinase [Bacteroidota bacterium]
MKKNSWFANGKLLITGEYLVLEGAKALAVPLKPGQHFTINQTERGILNWTATSPEGTWFKAKLKLPSLEVIETTSQVRAERLVLLLRKATELSDHFLKDNRGFNVETKLDFNPEFGFGSSSTLIYCLAQWAQIDPYKLQKETFGGSGFDIACADAEGPITFVKDNDTVQIQGVEISPAIIDHLYFVYLGKKQQTSKSIHDFRKNASYTSTDIDTITSITNQVIKTESIEEFEILLMEHEKLMSRILKSPTIKSSCFSTFDGCVKSLGAWGGDFVLVSSQFQEKQFAEQMKNMGFPITFSYTNIVLG